MIASTAVRMSLSEYMRYTSPPGFRDELIEGELILSASPNRRHADGCHKLIRLTKEEMKRKKGMYLGTGAIAVWLVNYVEETIEVYTQSQAPITYRLRSFVPLPPELGGEVISVKEIFTGIVR